VATTSAISSIIGSTLTYRGIDIDELAAHSAFEETTYLLWYGDLPAGEELKRFSAELARNRSLPPPIADLVRRLPLDAPTMALLRTAISALALYDPVADETNQEANRAKAARLLASFPALVALIHRLRAGDEPIAPDATLGHAANFLYMLSGERPTPASERVMDVALILHADHELNASTFSARVAASTLADLHSAIVAAVSALKGPLHGGANEAVMRTLADVGSVERVAPFVRETLDRRGRLMGFGHRVYREGDPRARWLKRLSQELSEGSKEPEWYAISATMEEEVREATGLLPNVDFYSASVYTYMGIPRELFTPIFAMSRVAGWIAHVLEQYADNRLIRPRAEYIGLPMRPYIPLEQR
jgi:citrate synthase